MTAEHLGGTGGLPKHSVPSGSLRTVQRHLRPAKPNRMSFWGNGYVGRKLNMKTFINMLRAHSGLGVRSMLSRQSLIALGIAIVLGVAAVFLANNFLTGRERQAYSGGTTRVAVAATQMAYGSDITADKIRFVDYPNSSIPPG